MSRRFTVVSVFTFLMLWGIIFTACALPTAETSAGGGIFAYDYQNLSLGDERGKSHNFLLDLGVNDTLGGGMTLYARKTESPTGTSSLSIWNIYLKYQFMETFEVNPAVAAYAGYRWFNGTKDYTSGSKAGTSETLSLSGFELGGIIDLPFTFQIKGLLRVGFISLPGGSATDVEFGLSHQLSENIDLELGFGSLAIEGTPYGGFLIGLRYKLLSGEVF